MPSSVIAGFDYDTDHATLTVVFVSGRIYRYFAVPAEVATIFRKASSKGTYFNTHIRDHYPFREITAAPA